MVPNFRTVVGEDAQGMAEFMVVDRVFGDPLDSLVAAKADLPQDAMNRTFKSILPYLREGQAGNITARIEKAITSLIETS